MKRYPTKALIEEARALVRLYLFLRYDCGLKETDRLSARNLKELLRIIVDLPFLS